MKIKRFVASNMRQALLSIRKEQGPNAVILSNRRVDGGIEVVAAVDYDETLMNQPSHQTQSQSVEPPLPPTEDALAQSGLSQSEESHTDEQAAQTIQTEDTVSVAKKSATVSNIMRNHTDVQEQEQDGVRESTLSSMQKEICDMRSLLTDQLASLAWNDEVRRDPVLVRMLRHYAQLGLDADVARSVAASAVARKSAGNFMLRASESLAESLPILDDKLLDKGGVLAIVGPTGVGKTTTIAKLAARFALRHGRDQVALISTDSFRIGAQEQLATFAQILDVPVHLVTDEDDLSVLLGTLADKKLVLIDTAGVSQRAQGLSKHLNVFRTRSVKIRMYLAVAATVQSETLDEIVRRFACVSLDGCILTKIDEAASLGAALSTLIRHKLPITYLTNGQRVPEDLHAAVGKKISMVNYCTRLMSESKNPIGEDFMARNFGEVRTHAYA